MIVMIRLMIHRWEGGEQVHSSRAREGPQGGALPKREETTSGTLSPVITNN